MPARRAWILALIVSGILAVLAAAAIAIWLTDARTDYYPMVAVMTAITAFVSAAVAWASAPQERARSLTYYTAFISLIVPIGVASVWVGWLLIVPVLVCYAIFRASYALQLRGCENATAGVLDGLAWASLGIAVGCGIFVAVVASVFVRVLFFDALGYLIALAVAVVWSARWIGQYAAREIISIGGQTNALQTRLSTTTVLCYALPAACAALTFWGQGAAQGWFTSLWKPG
jgi:hypothetical protein